MGQNENKISLSIMGKSFIHSRNILCKCHLSFNELQRHQINKHASKYITTKALGAMKKRTGFNGENNKGHTFYQGRSKEMSFEVSPEGWVGGKESGSISCARNRMYTGGELEGELEELRRKDTHTPLMRTHICEWLSHEERVMERGWR